MTAENALSSRAAQTARDLSYEVCATQETITCRPKLTLNETRKRSSACEIPRRLRGSG